MWYIFILMNVPYLCTVLKCTYLIPYAAIQSDPFYRLDILISHVEIMHI